MPPAGGLTATDTTVGVVEGGFETEGPPPHATNMKTKLKAAPITASLKLFISPPRSHFFVSSPNGETLSFNR